MKRNIIQVPKNAATQTEHELMQHSFLMTWRYHGGGS